jgi:predicted phosphohydrolase
VKLAWLSDIHLDQASEAAVAAMVEEGVRSGADVFCLTGDVSYSERLRQDLGMLTTAFGRPLCFVLGNHDYYYSSWEQTTMDVVDWCRSNPLALWLSHHPFVSLTPEVAVVGHDAWADGRLGDFQGIWKQVQDFYLVENLSNSYWEDCLQRMRDFADHAAEHLERVMAEALETHEAVVVLTHVPPFPEVALHEGAPLDEDWLPHYCCSAVGDSLRRVMLSKPDRAALVLCGHTHSAGKASILPNLLCLSGSAEYGRPRLQGLYDLDLASLRSLITT